MKKTLTGLMLAAMLALSGCSTASPAPSAQDSAGSFKDKETAKKTPAADGSVPACSGQDTACDADAGTDSRQGMEEISFEQALQDLEHGKTGIYYFGFENCPWCQEAVPLLLEEAGETGQQIRYVKTRDADKNRLYDEEQKARITPYIREWMSDNDQGELTLYVPPVIRVENGEVTGGHEGTVEGHDAKERTMTDTEKEELRAVYKELLRPWDAEPDAGTGS